MKKHTSRILSLLLVLALLCSVFTVSAADSKDVSALTEYTQGADTSAVKEFKISSADALTALSSDIKPDDGEGAYNMAGVTFYLANDIKLSGSFTPISNVTYPADAFAGTFDGNGHSITGLSINSSSTGGIGLFRSEFLYLEKEDYPTEEEQFKVYKTAVETMAGKNVIIRTLDIGADKQCAYFNMEHEENPALGYRAIRICLTQTDVFKTQLRALFRASAYGKLSIMYPMITSLWEVRKIKEIVEEVKAELDEQGIAYGEPKQGIMIETPAAVMVSGELAKEVDFFSIGTNDLTQYTLAVDRQNPKLDRFFDPHHPAILAMIRMVVENAHKAGIWAGICGELGADTSLTKEFLAMGVDELSVSAGSILPIRKIILETDLSQYGKDIK